MQCNTAIGVAVLLPFLSASSLNFGPLATAAFFLGHSRPVWRGDSGSLSSCLSGSRHNADPLGEGYKLRQGPNLHFLHHPVAMGLDGTLGTA